MYRHYTFIPFFILLLACIAWLGHRVEVSVPAAPRKPAAVKQVVELKEVHPDSIRQELIAVLEGVVSYSRYYRSVYGHYSKLLSRVGYPIPPSISSIYEIRIDETSPRLFHVTAFSEVNGKIGDVVTINQDFQLHANFRIPPPRVDYLRLQAMKHMRLFASASEGQILEEAAVYRGFFKYQVLHDTQNKRIVFAAGIRSPVLGEQLKFDPQNPDSIDAVEFIGLQGEDIALEPTVTGQWSGGNRMSTVEEAYLAQRIFMGEIGRYAKSWLELSKIASFRFENRQRYGMKNKPFVDKGRIPEVEVLFSSNEPPKAMLEIEPIVADANGPDAN